MSALVQLDGLPVTHARISMPRIGVWHAEIALAQIDAFAGGRATLQFGPSLSLTGTVRRSGSADGAGVLILVGGAGNLWKPARAQAYRQAPVRLPLNDLLQTAEERLATTAEQEVLQTLLPFWVTPGVPIAQCLEALMEKADASWRILPEGTLWVGSESWPDAPRFDHILITELPVQDAFELYTSEPNLLPGQTFRNRHVSYVEHSIKGDEIQTLAFLEAA